MSLISSLGVGSGLDLANLVDELVSAERKPADRRLDRNEEQLQVRLTGFGRIRSALEDLRSDALRLGVTQEGRKATVSNEQALAVRTSSDADAGRYTVSVDSLASAHSLASESFEGADDEIGAGALTLQLGDGAEATLEFGVGDTLRDLRDAINEAGLDIQATLVNDVSGTRLLLNGQRTGASEFISLQAGEGLDPRLGDTSMTQTVAPGDAEVMINGLNVTAPSNQLENVLPGVTLDLRNATPPGEPATVEVGLDREAIADTVSGFVETYNTVMTKLNELTGFDFDTQEGGPMMGDATLRGIASSLRAVVGGEAFSEGDTRFMVNLGVRTAADGTLSFDRETLEERIDTDLEGVLGVLNGFGTNMSERVRGFAESGGLLSSRSESIRRQLRSIEGQREQLETRMQRFEARTRRQFSAMDAVVAELRSTGDFLDQQLSALNNNRR